MFFEKFIFVIDSSFNLSKILVNIQSNTSRFADMTASPLRDGLVLRRNLEIGCSPLNGGFLFIRKHLYDLWARGGQ